MNDGWHRADVGTSVPFEVGHAAEEQAMERAQKAGLGGLAEPARMLTAIFARTTDRGVLLAEVGVAELGRAANLRPARAEATLSKLTEARAIFIRRHDHCCLLVGIPPEGYFWSDERLELDADLLGLVRERRQAGS